MTDYAFTYIAQEKPTNRKMWIRKINKYNVCNVIKSPNYKSADDAVVGQKVQKTRGSLQ